MTTLREKVMSGMSTEDKCDILCSLIDLVMQNQNIGSDPDGILLDEDNHVTIQHLGDAANLTMLAPEVLKAVFNGEPLPEIGQEHAWFTLGMLAYFLFYQEEYYEKNNIQLTDLDAVLEGRNFMIRPNEAGGIPFGQAVSQLTALDPKARGKGVLGFTKYLKDNMPGTANISYLCQGREVGTESRRVLSVIHNLVPGGSVTFNGMRYQLITQPVTIPYRPGVHSYSIEVKELGSADVNVGRWLYIDKGDITGAVGDLHHYAKVLNLSQEDMDNYLQLRGRTQINLIVSVTGSDGRNEVRGTIQQELPGAERNMVTLYLRYKASENVLMTVVRDLQGNKLTKVKTIKLGDRT